MKRISFLVMMQTFGVFLQATWQAIYGVYLLSRLPYPIVTFFGGTRAQLDITYGKEAAKLASMFAAQDMTVISGGGPGIMEAANCGAVGKSLGIGIEGIDDAFHNPCAQVLKVNHFFVRKWLLMHYSIGFVVFPGGIGTADELFELLNHRKHNKLGAAPIVLIGKAFWKPLEGWLDVSLKEGFTKPEYRQFFIVTDDLQEALTLVRNHWSHTKE